MILGKPPLATSTENGHAFKALGRNPAYSLALSKQIFQHRLLGSHANKHQAPLLKVPWIKGKGRQIVIVSTLAGAERPFDFLRGGIKLRASCRQALPPVSLICILRQGLCKLPGLDYWNSLYPKLALNVYFSCLRFQNCWAHRLASSSLIPFASFKHILHYFIFFLRQCLSV